MISKHDQSKELKHTFVSLLAFVLCPWFLEQDKGFLEHSKVTPIFFREVFPDHWQPGNPSAEPGSNQFNASDPWARYLLIIVCQQHITNNCMLLSIFVLIEKWWTSQISYLPSNLYLEEPKPRQYVSLFYVVMIYALSCLVKNLSSLSKNTGLRNRTLHSTEDKGSWCRDLTQNFMLAYPHPRRDRKEV